MADSGQNSPEHPARRGNDGHPIFAAVYDRMGEAAERGWLGELRSRLLSGVEGVVLEIGGGTGANLSHYQNVGRLVVAEPDPYMRRRLAQKLGRARVPVEVSAAEAGALPFPDGSFDAVVSTLVLCTVPDQRVALSEIRRVLRPGGRLLFMEHVRGEGFAGRFQDGIDPLWRRLFGGCRPNRNTVASILDAGLYLESLESLQTPGPFASLIPHVQGTAVSRPAAC